MFQEDDKLPRENGPAVHLALREPQPKKLRILAETPFQPPPLLMVPEEQCAVLHLLWRCGFMMGRTKILLKHGVNRHGCSSSWPLHMPLSSNIPKEDPSSDPQAGSRTPHPPPNLLNLVFLSVFLGSYRKKAPKPRSLVTPLFLRKMYRK